jgi:carboxyl-terminal processing protease
MSRRLPAALLLLVCFGGLAMSTAAAPAEKKPPPAKQDYYDLYRLLADTIDHVERDYVKEVDRRELVEAAIKGILSKLDPYSAYISPEELDAFRSAVESEFGGIGIQVAADDGDLRVLSPIYDTPAYHAGILAGDHIIEIDGKSTEGMSLNEVMTRIKGKEHTSVVLTVIHAGKSQKEKITVARERIRVETVLADRRKSNDTWDFLYDPQTRIGYVRVTAFGRETGHELQKALQELQSQKLRGLILDLRFNPGGLLTAAIEVSRLFISQGRIVSTKGRNTPERNWDAHKGVTFEGFPMVILVNRYSASASEIVAACLQDHHRAVVMGERTWGKGSVQNVIELENRRSALKLTTAGYVRPSGKNIDRLPGAKDADEWGVTPDKDGDLRLGEGEMAELVADRRDRDIIRPRGDGQAKPDGAAATKTKTPFVDRQLEMAVKYLSGELARAK